MIVFGLTGGIASGKSTVARLLEERGAVALDADRLAHEVLNEPEVREAIRQRWGDAVFEPTGELRRSEIARRVFGGDQAEEQRRLLEGLVHPRVRRRLQAGLAEAHTAGAPAAVLDIPLLHEAGWADQCDAILFADAPAELRRQRAADRGWTPEELAERERAQMPIEEKRERADLEVPCGSIESAREAVARAWRRWVDGDRG